MTKEVIVPKSVVKRLPKYYIYLQSLAKKGIIRASSNELSEITGFTASQIRQDLNHFGGFGQQGYGYNVLELKNELRKILGIDKSYKAIMIGMGNIAKAIFHYTGFKESGLSIIGIFEKDVDLIGTKIDGIDISDIEELEDFLKENKVDVAVLAIPQKDAKEVAQTLINGKVKGIWNFTSIDIKMSEKVVVENVHLDESLYTLTYYINNIKDYKGKRP